MKVALLANMCDQTTVKIADALHRPFKSISVALSKEYGGNIEHLWIDFELIRSHCEARPIRSFRFQRKVGGSLCSLTGLRSEVSNNVGHYYVRPNFDTLLSLPYDSVVPYVLSIIYDSTAVLVEKAKKLDGFNAVQFRADFLLACAKNGYPLNPRIIKTLFNT